MKTHPRLSVTSDTLKNSRVQNSAPGLNGFNKAGKGVFGCTDTSPATARELFKEKAVSVLQHFLPRCSQEWFKLKKQNKVRSPCWTTQPQVTKSSRESGKGFGCFTGSTGCSLHEAVRSALPITSFQLLLTQFIILQNKLLQVNCDISVCDSPVAQAINV